MIRRTLEGRLRDLAGPFPVIFLTGPRQSGKTTLARATFPDFEYYSLEDLQVRSEVIEDPRGFLGRLEGARGVVIDEAQRAPDLFSYLQGFVDERRSGPIVLTGSQQFLLSDGISQSLAGRAAILELLPFSYAELTGREPLEPDDLVSAALPASRAAPDHELDRILFSGLYPRIHDAGLEPEVWLDTYVRTYIERDVRMITNVGDLDTFSRFVQLCAGRSGQLLNLSALGADAGLDQKTARRWLSLMRTSYVVDLLHPHHKNFRKRIVKTPKLYFTDSGLLCHLLGISNVRQLHSHPLRGAIFETFVVSELRKVFTNRGRRPSLFFWRDSRGREVDVVVDLGGVLVPMEIKSGRTVAGDFFTQLDFFRDLAGCKRGWLVYGGDEVYEKHDHQVCSWSRI